MQCTVKRLKQKDAGRGLVFMDRAVADELDAEAGDYVRLVGHDSVVGRVYPGYPEDQGTGVIRVDGRVRSLLGVEIDDGVTVERIDVRSAELVAVSVETETDIETTGEFGEYVRHSLRGTPVIEGQVTGIDVGLGPDGTDGQHLPLEVIRTEPDGVVVITENTTLRAGNRVSADLDAVAAEAGVAYLPSSDADDAESTDADAGASADEPGESDEPAQTDSDPYHWIVRRRLRENTLLLGTVVFVLLAVAVPFVGFVLARETAYSFATWATVLTGVASVVVSGGILLLQLVE